MSTVSIFLVAGTGIIALIEEALDSKRIRNHIGHATAIVTIN
jgi:hypothetical protein